MAKAYYFNYIPVSDTSQCSTDEAAHICDQMIQIVIAAFKEYGLYVKDNNYFSCGQGKKLLSDEKCFCCVYPDKLGAAWDHSTWDYNRDKSGEIFVVFKKDNKIVVSFGTNRIAKENSNEEIISRIREKAVDAGVLSEESAIFETEERIVEKPKSNAKVLPDKAKNKGEQIIEKTDEKTVYKKTCQTCKGKGKVQTKEAMQSFSKDKTNGDVERVCSTCNGTGYVTVTDYVGKYGVGKKVSLKELDDYLKEKCKIQNKIFELIEEIKEQYAHVIDKDSFWLLLEKKQYFDDHKTYEEETITYSFILDSAGNLRCKQSSFALVLINQEMRSRKGSEGEVSFQNFDEYMREFDFDAFGRYTNSSFLEYTHLVKKYKDFACRSDSDMAFLTRNYEKGYGLYYALKSILEEGKQPQNPDKPDGETNQKKMASKKGNGGCYVATAIYGSYDCPEVWTLRRYRDYKLAKTFWGRIFIRVYYVVSPTIVRLVGDTKWFSIIWRYCLDKMVMSLRDEGFDSTPYEDRDWMFNDKINI